MKLSELIEKVKSEMTSKRCEFAVNGVSSIENSKSLPRTIIKAVREQSILKLSNDEYYLVFLAKCEELIDRTILGDLYNRIEKENGYNILDEYYISRMCGIINVMVFRLVEDDVF